MTDKIEALERLARLRDNGTLTQDEFLAQKAALLANDTPAPDTTFGERWRDAREQSRATRRVFRWFWGLSFAAVVLVGIYFLSRGQALYDARERAGGDQPIAVSNTQAPAAAGAPAAGEPPVVSAEEMDSSDFAFTDQSLASDRPTWETLGQGPNSVRFCTGAQARVTNATSRVMHIKAGVQESDVSWPIGTVAKEGTITFDVGEEPGSYALSSLDDGLPLAAYEVSRCDAQGNFL